MTMLGMGYGKQVRKMKRVNMAGCPGAVKEVDQDNSGTITPDKDRVILGTPFPDWTGSITNTFTYKDFDFSVFIYTRQGEMKWSKFHTELQNEYLGEINQLKVDYWTPENPSNTFYRPGFNGGNTSLLCYKKTSFVRVGNMTLGYNMPLKWLKNLPYIQDETVRHSY